ncbi:hypothetical protein RXV95_01980 [Novosphingobium sp. ZN18A2]|uniref:hypothetical protein n=1 Tax=Novosphingobium sp. ZN18A2 TaxID=3079861 RepID=UPI0030CED839
MATTQQKSSRKSRRPASRGRHRRRWLLLPLALLAGLAAWYWPTIHGYAITGTSYGARVACSCRFVGGRGLADCKKDFEPGMEFVMLSEDASAQSVTARIPLISSQTATYRPGWGCQLQRWKD